MKFRPVTEVWWPISNDSLEALSNQLKQNKNETIKVVVNLRFERPRLDSTKDPKVHTTSIEAALDANKTKELSEIVKTMSGQVLAIN